MKVHIKKEDGLKLIPTLDWELRGTLVKKPRPILPEEVARHYGLGYRLYEVPGRYVFCSTHTHDSFFEAVKPERVESGRQKKAA